MWTRFLPKFDVIEQVLAGGALGAIRTVIADHGEFFTRDHRIYDPSWPVARSWISVPIRSLWHTWVFRVVHLSRLRRVRPAGGQRLTGQISAILSDAAGNQAQSAHDHLVRYADFGGHRRKRRHADHRRVRSSCQVPFTLARHEAHPGDPGRVLRYDEAPGGQADGLHFAAAEAARVITDGRIESDIHPLRYAISTLEVADEIRRQVTAGVHQP